VGKRKRPAGELDRLRREVKYLRWLVWLLSLPGLAAQHPKYDRWLKRRYKESRAEPGIHSVQWDEG
jgi:hypothetical protein